MARDGGTAAFGEIVRRNRPALIAFAGSLAPPSRAEDVVQESLFKAYAALQDGAEPEMLRAWLFRIVRNTAIDEQRCARHHEQLDESYDGVEQPPQALERRERIGALVLAIQDLPAAQRDAIVKRELEGRGHEEIGSALQLSPGAVRQLIYRARHTLREAAGALIPAAVLRAATLPGADEAVGGLGTAALLKLGLATVVATGTIVAGASIDRHNGSGTAEALQISPPRQSKAVGGDQTADDRSRSDRRDERSGSSNSGRGNAGNDGRDDRPSGTPGDDGSGGSSGPGDGSGSSGSSSSGSGSGGSGGDGSASSGPGSGDQTLTTGSDDGGGSTSGGSGSGDLLDPLESSSSGPG
jgi:RNA polymerase sigma factor (sigma-70 family)